MHVALCQDFHAAFTSSWLPWMPITRKRFTSFAHMFFLSLLFFHLILIFFFEGKNESVFFCCIIIVQAKLTLFFLGMSSKLRNTGAEAEPLFLAVAWRNKHYVTRQHGMDENNERKDRSVR